MNMPENSNISDGAQEEAFDKKVSSIIYEDRASDDIIWQNTQELLNYELEKRLFWQRIRYFASASAAAVILLAVVIYIVLAPVGISSNLLSAMEQEHISSIKGDVEIIKTTSTTALTEYFQKEKLLEKNECCCVLSGNNKDIKLKGGRVSRLDKCPCATIYAEYKNTPVTFFVFDQPAEGKDTILADKAGEFNAAMKRLMCGCTIGVISALDKQTLIRLLENVNTLMTDRDSCVCKQK